MRKLIKCFGVIGSLIFVTCVSTPLSQKPIDTALDTKIFPTQEDETLDYNLYKVRNTRSDDSKRVIRAFENAGLPNEDIALIKHAVDRWENTQKEGEWHNVVNVIYIMAKKHDLKSIVTISSYPTNGAVVRYQTWLERENGEQPDAFPMPTTSAKEMNLGEYYIWAERKGKPTSDTDMRYLVINESYLWTLYETLAEQLISDN